MSEVGVSGFYYNEAKVKAGCAGINSAADKLKNITLETLTSLKNATNFPEFSEIAGGSSYVNSMQIHIPMACNNISELQNIIAAVMVGLGMAQTTEDAKEIKSFDITNGSSVQLDEQGLCDILDDVLDGMYGNVDAERFKNLTTKYGYGIAHTVMKLRDQLQISYGNDVKELKKYNIPENIPDVVKEDLNGLVVYPNDSYYSYENMIDGASYYVTIANLLINNNDQAQEKLKDYSDKDKAVAQNLLDKYWNHNSDGLQVNDQICEDLLKNGNLTTNSKSVTSENTNSTTTVPVTNETTSPSTADPTSPAMSASTSNPTPQAAPTITSDEILKYANESIRLGAGNVAMPDNVRETVQNLVDYAYKNASNPSAVQALTATDDVLAIINGQ
jgi:hypothetical protein